MHLINHRTPKAIWPTPFGCTFRPFDEAPLGYARDRTGLRTSSRRASATVGMVMTRPALRSAGALRMRIRAQVNTLATTDK
jgi:hypothetical protein